MSEFEREFERELFVDEQEIADYLYLAFFDRGMIATTEECEVIAAMVFDFLIERAILEELEDFEDDFS